MEQPFRRERDFRALLRQLKRPATAWTRLLLVGRFFESCCANPAASEPYLLEVIQPFSKIVEEFTPVGADPRQLRRIYESFRRLVEALPDLQAKGAVETVAVLRDKLALSYAYIGGYEHAAELLGVEAPAPVDQSFTPPEQLALLAENTRAGRGQGQWGRLLEQFNLGTDGTARGVCVPVVERLPRELTFTGLLRLLDVQLFGRVSGQHDDIHADVSVFGLDKSRSTVVQEAVRAARYRISKTHPRLTDRYSGKVIFDVPSALHDGRSAHLAVAALLYCAFLEQSGTRVRYRLRPGVVITGNVDDRGTVRPVDEETLKAKTRAVFFSPSTAFVVPASQGDLAQEVIEHLREDFPRRQLPIVRAQHLEDVFHDRRVSERNVAGPLRFAGRWIWHRRAAALPLTLLVAMLMLIGAFLTSPLDRVPVSYELNGEVVTFLNQHGQEVEQLNIGASAAERRHIEPAAVGANPVRGTQDICAVQGGAPGGELTLMCRSSDTAEPRWAHSLSTDLSFPRSLGLFDGPMYPHAMIIGDLTGDGRAELLAALNHQRYFPAVVRLYDLETGKERAAYLHAGRIYAADAGDLTGDGVQEVVVGGINNALDTAFLAVLDPREMNGHGPITGRYEPEGWARAAERAYVRIPRTEVGEHLRSYIRWVSVRGIHLDAWNRTLQVRVVEAPENAMDGLVPRDVSYDISFNADLEPQRIGTGDAYDLMADHLLEEGFLDEPPTVSYFSEFMQMLMYWDGESWREEPFLRRDYPLSTRVPSSYRR